MSIRLKTRTNRRSRAQISRLTGGGKAAKVAALAIERTVLDLVTSGYDGQVDPYGFPWPSRQDNKPHPLLDQTGSMRDAFFTLLVGNTVTITNSANYSHFHQLGTDIMPQRAFFPDAGLPIGWATRFNLEITLALKAFK